MQKADSSVDFPSASGTHFTPVDVDLEAAGIAGNRQWGLDAGHHQDGWSPCPSWSDDASRQRSQ
ncbi:hypothetical protein BDZ89DRAFT_1079754, partial [Hymenopellis radicata]